MRLKNFLLLIISIIFFSCKKETQITVQPSPAPDFNLLLKDIVVSNLPSPYYHFEYNNNGNVDFVSFASEFERYEVLYNQGKVAEMRNNILVNKDRLQYFYDDKDRVILITYANSTGILFAESSFTYNAQQLIKTERKHKERLTSRVLRAERIIN